MIDELTMDDVAAAAALSGGFGWPHRPADWGRFLDLGQGFAWRQDGVLAGTALWFPLGDEHASIGLVQVAPGLQGRGVGRKLMETVIEAARPRSLMLHATAEGAGLYAKLGFQTVSVLEQWQGICTVPANPEPARAGPPGAMSSVQPGNVRLATADDLAAIQALDAMACGITRRNVLDWAMHDATVAIAGPADAPTGYAVCRNFGRGAMIGPMAATTEIVAIALAAFLAQPGFLRMDPPAGATTLKTWLGSCALVRVGEGQLMRRGIWPAPKGAALWAPATQAVG